VSTKRELLEALLRSSWAYLHVDGRADGVELPEWLREPAVKLQIGYDMPLPIPDLAIDDEGVRATLSFQRTPHLCRIPWRAIFAISDLDGRGAMFPDDVPPEVSARATVEEPPAEAQQQQQQPSREPAAGPGEKKRRPSHLKLVP
jgi:stringent starvation protein B